MEKEKLELLKQIAKNTSPKESMQIILTDNKTEFLKTFIPPLQFKIDKEYEVALIDLETYYSFPNIDVHNNVLKYFAGTNKVNANAKTIIFQLEHMNWNQQILKFKKLYYPMETKKQ